MSASAFSCRCGFHLGTVKNGALRHEHNVRVRNYLRKGYAVLTCPACGRERVYRGGLVETRLAKAG